jgi:RHS repeat-associated protein
MSRLGMWHTACQSVKTRTWRGRLDRDPGLAVRRLTTCLLCAVGLLCWSANISQAASLVGGSSSSVSGDPLVVSGVQALDEDQQQRAAEEARLSSPMAVAARQASRTEFEHLGAAQARALDASAFPAVLDDLAGGPPQLSAGERLVRYTSEDSAQVDLPGAKHGVILSLQPMASEAAPGHLTPLDLGLTEVGEAFEPKTSVAPVRISRRLQDGVRLGRSGVSLMAIDAQGRALAGSEGTLDGASVLYANTQASSDTLAKPTTGGFELDSLLRGAESPQTLYFRVGLPAGAKLATAGRGSSAVRVMDRGSVLAVISVPGASDAEGVSVPVSTSVSGDVLSVFVDDRTGAYGYPIVLDPTVEENVGGKGEILYGKTWGFYNADDAAGFTEEAEGPYAVRDDIHEAAQAGDFAYFYYKTQGDSKIYSLTARMHSLQSAPSNPELKLENVLGILNPHTGKLEAEQSWIGAYEATSTVCSSGGCAAGSVGEGNDESEVVYKQDIREDWTPLDAPYVYSALLEAKIGIVQEAGPSAAWDTTDERIEGKPNGMIPGTWVTAWEPFGSPYRAIGLDAYDPGVGLLRESWSSPNDPGWGREILTPDADGAVQRPECQEAKCGGSPQSIGAFGGLPNGEDTIDATVEDVAGLKASTSGVLKVDNQEPYDVHLEGLPDNNEVGFGRDRLAVSATEGSGSTPSSGIASIALWIDGKEIGAPNGSCSVAEGQCTATGNWEINGEEYAAGRHRVKIEATSGAGMVTTQETTITLVSSESKHVGPGLVNLASGAFTLPATDVSIAGPGASLTVERSYDSRLADEGEEGPFGPQWQGLSFSGSEKLTKLPTGSVILTASSGQGAIFTREGSGFVAPAGDANLKLSEEGSGAFTLSDSHGDVTKFTVPEGGSGTVLTPTSREEPGHAGATRYTFRTVNGVTEPTQALAPMPAGVSCSTLVRGCRALTFTYASNTTAKGEAPEEWGEYAGRLMKISFTAYNTSRGEMQTIAVAQYAYDAHGRLRAEWDPRISPALKTVYGYDSEGHVTSVTPPGQQPWLMHYGTIESDATGGRLLSVTRPSAASALGNDLAPSNSEAPQLSTASPIEGQTVSISIGRWSNEPLSYSYQWERCNAAGADCAIMPGATNQAYTVRYGDEEHTIAALVTATNAGGSTTTTTAVSAEVPYTVPPPTFLGSFGEAGTGNGKLSSPSYVAVDEAETPARLYVTDTGNDRVEEFEQNGDYLGKFGEKGSGYRQFDEPTGIGVFFQRGRYVSVADSGNKRVMLYWASDEPQEVPFSSKTIEGAGPLGGLGIDEEAETAFVAQGGEHSQIDCLEGVYESSCAGPGGDELTSFGSTGTGKGQLQGPGAVAVSPLSGDVYVTDTGNDRVEYFNGASQHLGEYLGEFGVPGTKPGELLEPKGIAIGSKGDVWVVDSGNGRVQVFTAAGKPLIQFGEKSAKAIREEHEKQVREEEEKEPAKQRKARERREAKENTEREKREAKERKELEKKEKKKLPTRKQEEAEALEAEARGEAPPHLDRPVGIAAEDGKIYVVDSGDDRVMMWAEPHRSEQSLPPATPPSAGSSAVWTIDYQVPVSGTSTGAPNLSASQVSTWGQVDDPVEGTAIFPPDEPMGWPASEYKRASIFYLDSKGHTVNTVVPSGVPGEAIATSEYNSSGDVVRTLSADDRIAALAKGGSAASELSTVNTYNSEGTELLSTTGPEHTVKLANGQEIQARKVVKYSYDENAPSEGGPYALVTKETEAALNESGAGEEEDIRTTRTSYSGEGGLGWKLRKPTSVTADAEGLGLEHVTVYEAETGNVIETRQPANAAEKSPHATETIYYTAGANSKAAACGEHPEWAELPCRTRPAKQPETAGLPSLPVTTVTKYSIWDEPEITEEAAGAKTRTKTVAYDAAGRPETSSVTASVGTTLPAVTYRYSAETGALVSQASGGRTITSVYNTLGQLVSYTDADGGTTAYTYTIDGQPKTINDGKGTETFSYSTTTGLPTELVNEYGTSKLTFTATYDPEGRLLTEGYPNGMAAKYTYNAVGEANSLEYVKTSDCTSACTWFSDSVVPSIEGQWMTQTSTLSGQASSQSYSFDGVGRLTQVQSTPAGKGCTTRIYAYDRDTNRTSLTTREPNSGGHCAAKGESAETRETHTYDEADRLTDAGVSYNEFGDITTLPATDAGGSELTSAYYSDNQLQSMTQHASHTQPEETIGYDLDPAGRVRETLATGSKTSDVVSHYAGPGSTPEWTASTSGEEWTRNIPGIDGRLAAIQSNGETPVLQLGNLHGDIIATAYLSESATGLASTIKEANEFGVPATEAPPKYSWLGAIELPTELPSGVVTMGVRSYVPQLGRFLQPDPISGGSANAYTYTFGNPLNTTDPSGESAEYMIGGPSAAAIAWAAQSSAEAVAQQAAENAAARAAAERLREEQAAEDAAAYGPLGGEGEWEEWEEWEEEGENEYVSDHQRSESGNQEHRYESGVLYQPLDGEAAPNGTASSTIPLCEAVANSPCARSVPDDHSPDVESECNRTGQGCSGHRGGGHTGQGHVTVRDVACTIIGAVGGAIGEVPGALIAGGACIIIWR